MNENENRKNDIPKENIPQKHNEEFSQDFEIFDLDAVRRVKAENANKQISAQNTNSAHTPSSSGIKPTQNNISHKVPATQKPVAEQRNAKMQSQSFSPRQPQANNTAAKKPITDIKPDKVVFDSSADSKNTKSAKRQKAKQEKVIKVTKPTEEKTRGANPVAVLSKALIYIAVVLLVSFLCAYYIIVIANDVFAFVKADTQVEVVIPQYATLDQIADELHDKEVIKYPKIFVLYTMIRKNDPGEYIAGTYTVSPSQNFDELLYTFVKKTSNTRTEVSVTIPEGYTVDDIINLFVNEKGIGTKEGFVDAIQNGEYDYWFIKDLTNLNANRKYRLEGYLYPDTYYVYKESEEAVIIDKMLANFHSKFNIEYKQECENAGMTVDEVINLASLIQMEAKYSTDYSMVSSVFHNRLKSTYFGKKLESCASVQYILPERKERLSNEDTKIDNPYNTYQNAGLPPGPISNPTLKAIRAALYPEESNYYFFMNDIKGDLLFAKTLAEHNANKAMVDKQYANANK